MKIGDWILLLEIGVGLLVFLIIIGFLEYLGVIFMAGFGDFYNKNKKKPSKEEQAKKANRGVASWVVPTPQVISKGKKDKFQ